MHLDAGISMFRIAFDPDEWDKPAFASARDVIPAGLSIEGTALAPEDLPLDPTGTWYDEAGNEWAYREGEDSTCAVCSVRSAGELLEVPSSIAGLEVVAIAPEACANSMRLRGVVLPPTVRTIGRKAFAYCGKLEDVAFAEGLVSIGSLAFTNTGLPSLRMPSTLEQIGDKTFFHCRDLRDIQLNEGLIALGSRAFAQTPIEVLDVPASVSEMGLRIIQPQETGARAHLAVAPDNPFYLTDPSGEVLYRRGSDGLMLVDCLGDVDRHEVLPDTRVVGPDAFAQRQNLQKVVLPEGLAAIGSGAFRSCPNLTELALPNTLVALGARAFIGSGVRRFALPASLEMIDDASLLVFNSVHAASNSSYPVIDVDEANPRLFIEGGVLCRRDENGVRALAYAGTEPIVRLGRDVTEVGNYLFYGASGIEELFVHDGIAPFDPQAFAVSRAINKIHLEVHEPIDGHGVLEWWFSVDPAVRHHFTAAFEGGTLTASALAGASDKGIKLLSDRYELGRLALQRLADPVLVDDERERYLRDLVATNAHAVCREFARHNYNEGFKRLIDLGFITPDTFEEALEWAREAGGTAAVGYLLELKHERFGATLMDEYDL